MNIVGIDHIVLTVKNMDASVRFYESVLGMTKEVYGDGRVALKCGSQKINLHEHGNEYDPKAHIPNPGSGDLCFVTETELKIAMQQVRNAGVAILDGPVQRTGATGPILSFYFRDPDGNLIEVANYAERS
jgi:catechol 2,3-dioxygenase-like lactoylglutathione lyase family enzyme